MELTRKNGVSIGVDSFMCNEVACSKATGLTYCNVEWVNACAIWPKMRLTLSGFSPLQALTCSLHVPHPATGVYDLDALWWTAGAETSEKTLQENLGAVL